MKFFRLDLLTLLISLFILNSCKNQDTLGLGINTVNQLNGSLIDTSTIIVNTIPEDSVVTNTAGITKMPLAYFKDPVLGITEANTAIDLNLPNNQAYTIPTGTITIDSALLVLRYTNGFYGDSIASRYKVNVYQLNEKMGAQNYYNTKKWKYNSGSLLGTQTFYSRTHDSIKIAVGGIKDSLQKVAPQIRIPINKNFINASLFNTATAPVGTNLVFKNAINGLYITLDKAQTTGAGGVFMFATDTLPHLDVYYRVTNGSTIDTSVVSLQTINHASEIRHTFSTAVQTELNNTTKSRNVVYLQGLAGLRAKISFPYLKNIVKTLGSDIIINRAELVITPTPGTAIPFAPIPQVAMYRYDLAHQRQAVQDDSTDPRSIAGAFSGYYSSANQNYHFTITAYVDDLLRGKTTDYGTFLGVFDSPTILSTNPYVPSAQVASRTLAVGSDSTSPYRIKLNIIYTKLPK